MTKDIESAMMPKKKTKRTGRLSARKASSSHRGVEPILEVRLAPKKNVKKLSKKQLHVLSRRLKRVLVRLCKAEEEENDEHYRPKGPRKKTVLINKRTK